MFGKIICSNMANDDIYSKFNTYHTDACQVFGAFIHVLLTENEANNPLFAFTLEPSY